MKTISALKYTLLTIVFFSSIQWVTAQTQDTTLYLFKSVSYGNRLVETIDSADFIRIIPPYRLSDPLVGVNEYYKGGKLKFTGKGIVSTLNLLTGNVEFEGTCIAFYPTGKRKVITNYKEGSRSGLQYFYYPEGKLYLVVDNLFKQSYSLNGVKIVDVFDKDGVQLCKDGNGISINYDDDYNELERGPVKNGKREGEWHGVIRDAEAGTYTLFYKSNRIESAIGYESVSKKSYPFQRSYVPAAPSISPANFVSKFKDQIKLPKGSSVTKSIIDSVRISFVVEEDGRLTQFNTIGSVSTELLEALKQAFGKSAKWEAAKYFGIPVKVQVTLSLNILDAVRANGYNRTVENSQTAMYNGLPIKSQTNLRLID
jgi:antitoxin component YwqK of YwqJK toxin-antitoxin module